MPDERLTITAENGAEIAEKEEETQEKESIWKFYFQSRWQTGLTTHFLFAVIYLSLFYVSNIWVAFKFAFFTLFGSAHLLGPWFAFWGVVFEISSIIPFIISWYAIFLLPLIWRSHYSKMQKAVLTIVMIASIIMIVVIADTVARYALDSEVLHEFVEFHDIKL